MKKGKILKIIGIILLVLLILLMVHTIRNTIIICNLQKKAEEYSSINNYHIKETTKLSDNTTMIINQYKKGEKELLIIEKIVNEEKVKVSYYNTGSRIDMFAETIDEKIAELGKSKEILGKNTMIILQTDNLWQTILYSVTARITTTKVNDYECYSINNFLSPYNLLGENKTEYDIDKETGLVRKTILDEQTTIREYEFGNVDNSIFQEPDIGQYNLKK